MLLNTIITKKLTSPSVFRCDECEKQICETIFEFGGYRFCSLVCLYLNRDEEIKGEAL
jgi:hypothetical protein